MSLGKLGTLLFLEYWNQFGSVKGHLSRSVFELVKAMEESLKIVQKGTRDLSFHPLQSALMEKAFAPLSLLLRYSEHYTAKSSPDIDVGELKSHVVQSLVEALDAEIARTSAEEALANPLKIKALESVKRVLLEGTHVTAAPVPQEEESTGPEENAPISLEAFKAMTQSASQAAEDSPIDVSEFLEAKTA